MQSLSSYNDRYAQELERQNNGMPCTGCGCHSGHTYKCVVLNPVYTEKRAALTPSGQEYDASFLRALGIEWF